MTKLNRVQRFAKGSEFIDFLSPGVANKLHGGVGVSEATESVPSPHSPPAVIRHKQPPYQATSSTASSASPQPLQQLKSDYCYLHQQIHMLEAHLPRYKLTTELRQQLTSLELAISKLEADEAASN